MSPIDDPSLEVVLARCGTYDSDALDPLVDMLMRSLLENDTFHGKTVLLKPNLISAVAPPFGCTSGAFICAVASWFLSHGARVLLGDSPALGSVAKVCEKQGITRALKGMKVEMREFSTPMRKELAGGVTVTVAREALECDLLVGLPKVKAHNQMFVTLSVKNIFGIVKGTHKAMVHMAHGQSHNHFAGIIIDLISILPRQLHLVDGIQAMHRSGPIHGDLFGLHCIAGAKNPIALDTALLALLKLDLRRSPLWQVAADRKLAGWNLDDLAFPQLTPDDFSPRGFITPDDLNAIRFNPLRFFRGMMKRLLSETD